jgi:hypothetical protein
MGMIFYGRRKIKFMQMIEWKAENIEGKSQNDGEQ